MRVCYTRADVNKNLLLKNRIFLTLLKEALLLDPAHVRNHGAFDQSTAVKSAIQRDAAECFMQLVLFAPGLDALQRDKSLLDSLRMLASNDPLSLSDDAKHYAEGALMALLPPPTAPTQQDHREAEAHVMVS